MFCSVFVLGMDFSAAAITITIKVFYCTYVELVKFVGNGLFILCPIGFFVLNRIGTLEEFTWTFKLYNYWKMITIH